MQHVFLVGAKSLGAYGGYETFINKLTEYHQSNQDIKYHVACKANGQGAKRPDGAVEVSKDRYIYHNADCFEITVPEKIGSAQAIYYDCAALRKSVEIITKEKIENPIVYVMACRIGPFFERYVKQIHRLGGRVFLNPDGRDDIIEETGRKASKIRLRDNIVSYPEHKYTLPSIPVLIAKPAYAMPDSFTAA